MNRHLSIQWGENSPTLSRGLGSLLGFICIPPKIDRFSKFRDEGRGTLRTKDRVIIQYLWGEKIQVKNGLLHHGWSNPWNPSFYLLRTSDCGWVFAKTEEPRGKGRLNRSFGSFTYVKWEYFLFHFTSDVCLILSNVSCQSVTSPKWA